MRIEAISVFLLSIFSPNLIPVFCIQKHLPLNMLGQKFVNKNLNYSEPTEVFQFVFPDYLGLQYTLGSFLGLCKKKTQDVILCRIYFFIFIILLLAEDKTQQSTFIRGDKYIVGKRQNFKIFLNTVFLCLQFCRNTLKAVLHKVKSLGNFTDLCHYISAKTMNEK